MMKHKEDSSDEEIVLAQGMSILEVGTLLQLAILLHYFLF
jgi:hypothetical protein